MHSLSQDSLTALAYRWPCDVVAHSIPMAHEWYQSVLCWERCRVGHGLETHTPVGSSKVSIWGESLSSMDFWGRHRKGLQ